MAMQWSPKKISELFRDKLEVPEYQRPYSWEKKQVRDFFNDLVRFIERNEEDYLFGQVIIHRENGRHFIVDGQQRITTATIYVCALYEIFEKRHIDNKSVRHDLESVIGFDDSKGFRLVLGSKNQEFFINYIQRHNRETVPKTKSDKLIQYAYLNLYSLIEEYISKYPGREEDILDKLASRFLDRFRVSHVETDDFKQAFIVFETLNARGMPLNSTDLLKNHFFSRLDPSNYYLKIDWEQMVDKLVDLKGGPNQYIRYFWNSSHRFVREANLFDQVADLSTEDMYEFLRGLFDGVERYQSIISPHTRKCCFDKESRHSLKMLSEFGATSFCPLAIALAKTKQTPVMTAKVLKAVECRIFRNQVVGKKTANRNEVLFADWAYSLSEGKKSIDRILKEIYQGTDSDSEFASNFVRFSPSASLAKALFTEMYNIGNTELKINEDGMEVQLEHIMPRSKGQWNVDPSVHKEYYERFGNLTLLDCSKNISISNDLFSSKRLKYRESQIEENRLIAEKTEWTPEDIDERQSRLCRMAISVWPKLEIEVESGEITLDTYFRKNKESVIGSDKPLVRNHSWTVESEKYAWKQGDFSLFMYKATGIPVNVRPFFGSAELEPTEKKTVILEFENEPFEATIVRKNNTSQVTQLFLDNELGHKMDQLFPEVIEAESYPRICFEKVDSDRYRVWFSMHID